MPEVGTQLIAFKTWIQKTQTKPNKTKQKNKKTHTRLKTHAQGQIATWSFYSTVMENDTSLDMAERRGRTRPPTWHIVTGLHLPLSNTQTHAPHLHGTNHPYRRSQTLWRTQSQTRTHKCQAKWQRPSFILPPFTAFLSHSPGGWRMLNWLRCKKWMDRDLNLFSET